MSEEKFNSKKLCEKLEIQVLREHLMNILVLKNGEKIRCQTYMPYLWGDKAVLTVHQNILRSDGYLIIGEDGLLVDGETHREVDLNMSGGGILSLSFNGETYTCNN